MKKLLILLAFITVPLYSIDAIAELELQAQNQVDNVLDLKDQIAADPSKQLPESAQDLVDAFKSLRQTINQLKEAYCQASEAFCDELAVKINILNEILKSLFEDKE